MNRRRTFPSLFSIQPNNALLLKTTSVDDMHLCVKRVRLDSFVPTSHQPLSGTHTLSQIWKPMTPSSKFKRVRCTSDPLPVGNTLEINNVLPSTASTELYSSTVVKDREFRLPGHRFTNLQFKGEGSNGIVVSALDGKIKKDVAIKKFQPFGHDVHT